jgi:hypothetical protein
MVDAVVCASESDITAAMRLVYERMKLAIEPSAAVGVAVVLGSEVRALVFFSVQPAARHVLHCLFRPPARMVI